MLLRLALTLDQELRLLNQNDLGILDRDLGWDQLQNNYKNVKKRYNDISSIN